LQMFCDWQTALIPQVNAPHHAGILPVRVPVWRLVTGCAPRGYSIQDCAPPPITVTGFLAHQVWALSLFAPSLLTCVLEKHVTSILNTKPASS